MTGVVQALPSRPLPPDVVAALEEHDDIDQAVAVRGIETADGLRTHQIILNIREERLFGLNWDGYAWEIVYDSHDDDDLDDEHDALRHAHAILEERAIPVEAGSRWEQTPPFYDSDWLESPGAER